MVPAVIHGDIVPEILSTIPVSGGDPDKGHVDFQNPRGDPIFRVLNRKTPSLVKARLQPSGQACAEE